MKTTVLIGVIAFCLSCIAKSNREIKIPNHRNDTAYEMDTNSKVIHILVALCDNKYQGIVPVPAKIGNGQDKDNNLYWGCSYGIRSYFKKSKDWVFIKSIAVDSIILERLIFKHKTQNYYLVADAYDGKEIKTCTIDFLNSCAGEKKDTIQIKGKNIGIYGYAKLVSYIGHNGLMDFTLDKEFENKDSLQKAAIILACYSKSYFSKFIKQTNTKPLIWTTGLMCPEAYTIHDAITAYIERKTDKEIQQAAASAYSKYQKCSYKAASGLLVNN